MIYTGLDWSGDSGDPARSKGTVPILALVAVTIDGDHVPLLNEQLARLREERHLPVGHPFHHISSKRGVRDAFFAGISKLPMSIRAHVIDKRTWGAEYFRDTDGQTHLNNAIVEFICGFPDDHIGDQTLLIDLERRDAKQLRELRTTISRALVATDRVPFEKIRACPDRQRDKGEIIQVADMVSGQFRENPEGGGPYLPRLHRTLTVFSGETKTPPLVSI